MRVWASIVLVVLLAPGLHAQYAYFSPDGSCSSDGMDCMSWQTVFHIFMRDAGPHTTGARFRLEVDGAATFGIENVGAVSPHEDVTVEEGDLFAGIELSWPDGAFAGGFLDTLLTIEIDPADPPQLGLYVITRDIELYSSSAEPAILDDFMYYCSHCYQGGGWIEWVHPDTVDAVIGQSSVIDLACDERGPRPDPRHAGGTVLPRGLDRSRRESDSRDRNGGSVLGKHQEPVALTRSAERGCRWTQSHMLSR